MNNIENIITNSGLSDIKDQIFEHVDNSTLAKCLLVSKDWYEALKRLKLRRHLLWLLTNSEIDTIQQLDMEFNYGLQKTKFIRVFPNWMELTNHFKRKGKVEDIEEVIHVLKLYISEPNYRAEGLDKASPIHYAAEKGHLAFLKILVPLSVRLDSYRPRCPPFLLACEFGQTQIVQFFLDFKDFEKSKDALYLACHNGHLDVVKLLVEQNDQDLCVIQPAMVHYDKQTIFHAACKSGNLDLVLYLIHNSKHLNLDLNLCDRYGKTALHIVCENGKTDIVNLLLDNATHGIDTCPVVTYSSRNDTILTLACEYRNIQTVKVLYERSKEIGLDLNKRNHHGFNAFLIACEYGQFDIVKFMVEHPEDFELNASSSSSENALHLACGWNHRRGGENGKFEVLKLLLDHPEIGLDVNQKDDAGATPLYNACCKSENKEMVHFLLANAKKIGIDVQTIDNHGETILHAAVSDSNSSFEIVKVIVSYANDHNLDLKKTNSDGETALDMANEHLSESLDRSRQDFYFDDEELERWRMIVYFLGEI